MGAQFMDRVMEDMEAAQQSIEIEYYWIEKDEAGEKLKQMLIRKAQEGVKVRVIMDNLITPFVPESFYQPLRDGGVELLYVHPFEKMGPFKAIGSLLGERDHRKIVVIDGRIGYTGGMNFYQRALTEWMDTQVRVEGPVALQLRALFEESWKKLGGSSPLEKREAVSAGEVTAQAVGSRGHEPLDGFLIEAIQNAREYFYLQTPYFAPTPEVVKALKDCAARGVDVRLLVPAKSDWEFMNKLTREYSVELYRAGLRVFVYNMAYDHTKVFITDDLLSSCGTVNMDYRSLRTNWEDMILFHDRETALHFKRIFLREATEAVEIGPEDEYAKGLDKSWRNLLRKMSPLF